MKHFTLETLAKALEILNIDSACNNEELKTSFRRLCSIHHPDKGGSTEKMQAINWAYKYVLKHIENISNFFNSDNQAQMKENQSKYELSEEGKAIFNKLILFPDLEIYIIGCWIWIEGNTKPIKEELKQLKLIWHAKKQMWCYAGSRSRSRGNMSFKEMCDAYGKDKHRTKETKKIVSE